MAAADELQKILVAAKVPADVTAAFVSEGYATEEIFLLCFQSDAALEKFLGRWLPQKAEGMTA